MLSHPRAAQSAILATIVFAVGGQDSVQAAVLSCQPHRRYPDRSKQTLALDGTGRSVLFLYPNQSIRR